MASEPVERPRRLGADRHEPIRHDAEHPAPSLGAPDGPEEAAERAGGTAQPAGGTRTRVGNEATNQRAPGFKPVTERAAAERRCGGGP